MTINTNCPVFVKLRIITLQNKIPLKPKCTFPFSPQIYVKNRHIQNNHAIITALQMYRVFF